MEGRYCLTSLVNSTIVAYKLQTCLAVVVFHFISAEVSEVILRVYPSIWNTSPPRSSKILVLATAGKAILTEARLGDHRDVSKGENECMKAMSGTGLMIESGGPDVCSSKARAFSTSLHRHGMDSWYAETFAGI
jgi:hypothetical protein